MDCEIVRQNLTEYSRRRLNSSESLDVARHLETCEDCRLFLEEERDFDLKLADMPSAEPKDDVWVMIRSRTHNRPGILVRVFASLPNPKRTIATAATLVAAVSAMFVVLPMQHQDHQGTAQVTVQERLDSQTAQRWSDDPMGANTDQVLDAVEEAL